MNSLQDTIALLTRFPAALDGLLRYLPDTWTRGNEGENTWSPFQVVAHLIHSERVNWIPRAKIILLSGESEPFKPFPRQPSADEAAQRSIAELLDEFARLRQSNLSELRSLNLQEADLAKRGRHPTFGIVTLSQLLSTWAVHDLTHLHQISRVMALRHKDAVGPWSAFLGVLRCTAHGD